jgi:mono/diheme cytochrome c family protein
MRALIVALVFGLPALASAESAPLLGDVHRGAQLYRLNCASCHGAEGRGDGLMARSLTPSPGMVVGTELNLTRTDGALYKLLHDGGSAEQLSARMPAFGDALGELELWDLVAFVRHGSYRVTDFFPNAGRYLIKRYTLDTYARQRLSQTFGSPPTADQANIEVATVFNGDRAPGTPATLEADDPVTLDSLKPRDRIGYVVFVNAQLPLDSKPLPVAIATDRDGKIVKVVSTAGLDDAARDAYLQGYVGQGHKGAHAPLIAPKLARGKKARPSENAKLLGFDAAYARAMEAATQYDKEERDRTWADTAK